MEMKPEHRRAGFNIRCAHKNLQVQPPRALDRRVDAPGFVARRDQEDLSLGTRLNLLKKFIHFFIGVYLISPEPTATRRQALKFVHEQN